MPLNLLRPNERPLRVRRRKTDLRARVNGNLRLDFGDVTLTLYAGLELFARYLRQSDVQCVGARRLRRHRRRGATSGWS